MKKTYLAAVLFLLSGCASFNSGDLRLTPDEKAGLNAGALKPAAELRVVWENFPYKDPVETIGEGRVQPEPPRAVPVPPGDLGWLRERAVRTFSEAGLYDAVNGTGTITLNLTSYGRWTYGEIFRSFLVDTGWIFIIPATLRTDHRLTAEYLGPSGRISAKADGRNSTTFHALLFPLYPVLPPGAREHSLLKKLILKTAADLRLGLRRAGAADGQVTRP